MMNPLDALSALSSSSVGQINFTPLTTSPGQPVSESFQLPQAGEVSALAPAAASASSASPTTWGHMVQQMVLDVNAKQQTAAQKVTDVLQGGPTPVHDAMVATEEASLSFEFLGEMRNKMVEAYQQVMQMQV